MKLLRLTCLLSGLLLLGSSVLRAQERPNFFIESLDPAFRIELDPATGAVTATNGVAVRYGDAVLTARTVLLNRETGDVVAEGAVHLQRGKEVWSGERVQYNFETRTLGTDSFRSGHTRQESARQRHDHRP